MSTASKSNDSVVGDYITGRVSVPHRSSKRTFKADEVPGMRTQRGQLVERFKLVHDLAVD